MAKHCCQNKAKELQKLQKQQSKVLWTIVTFSPVKSEILTGASNQNRDNCTASQFEEVSRFTG